ncbi:nose resistant to fluoxetine protein 6-like [Anopheles aquasalis]|uniref:nose resistant to fluoxetine protein 6-like n=1 Tax=Anopheles aquasalis TaxID=42839 RepID=UPI00215AC4E4|nr:nose resistant to fluoxetine protein 6-like [Anopheles aquasalis]
MSATMKLVIVCSVMLCSMEKVHLSEYRLMPRVFEFDDYDECLRDDPSVPGVYCMVKAVVQPNQSSRSWRVIEEYSRNWKQHYNHAHLDRGICLQNCVLKLAKLANDGDDIDLSSLVVPKFQIDFPYIIKNGTFRDVDEFRKNYSTVLAQCINYDLMQQHSLRAYTEIEYCDSNTLFYPIDKLDIAFVVVFASILTIIGCSSLYDHHCDRKLSHYKTELPSKNSMIFVSFSLVRNWYHLVSKSDDDFSHSMRHINALRFLIFGIINMGHNMLYAQPSVAMALERKYHEVMSMIIVSGSPIVTTFFVIGALMLFLSVIPKFEKRGTTLGIYDILLIVLNRYIRLTPTYAFLMFFEATWLPRYLGGPLWRKGFESSRTYCRKNWWANLLYINNYYATDEPCMQHSWYLAADFHLFIYGLIVCAIVLRFPKLRYYIVSFLLLICSNVAASIIYLKEYEVVTVLPPEPLRFLFWYWDRYHESYLPTQMYLVNYTTAILGSFYILHLKKRNFTPSTLFSVFWVLGVFAIPGTFIAGYFIFNNEFETPSIWMSIMFPVVRIVFTGLLVLLIIGLTFRAIELIIRLVNMHIFSVLGRLSYCAYLCHFFIIRAYWFNTGRYTHFYIVEMTAACLGTLFLSYVFAAFLCLVVESPFRALRKTLATDSPAKLQTSANDTVKVPIEKEPHGTVL